jgi:hypothetical protein
VKAVELLRNKKREFLKEIMRLKQTVGTKIRRVTNQIVT